MKSPHLWTLLFAGLILASGCASIPGPEGSFDAVEGLALTAQASKNRKQWEALAKKFAPKLYLHPDEKYHPSSVYWYLDRCILKRDGKKLVGYPTEKELLEHNKKDAYLQIADKSDREGDLDSARWYVHIRPYKKDSDKQIDIQYWVFYPYDNSSNFVGHLAGYYHPGDWEHVTVRVSHWRDLSKARIVAVYMARHSDEGRWITDYAVTKKTHPIAYSAKGSHASYPTKGKHWRTDGDAPIVGVDSTGKGKSLSYKRIQLVAVEHSLPGGKDVKRPKWLSFVGVWGEELKKSPRGPFTKKSWLNDGKKGL